MKVEKKECLECHGMYGNLGSHIISMHKLTPESYYNKFIGVGGKCERDGCNNLQPFNRINRGYSKFCSRSCNAQYQSSTSEFKLRMKAIHEDPIRKERWRSY